jgi:pimeloyl-ACP methyl ester carboxylesterase
MFLTKKPKALTLPLWREAFTGIDWLALKASPVFYGLGIPRGDNSPVVLIPGFMGNDWYLLELYFWLKRIGYRPYMSRIGWNAECPNILVDRLGETIAQAQAETNSAVHLIGHSLGGVLARAAAAQRPERIATLITLAAPFRDIKAHPLIIKAADMVRARLQKARPDYPDCYTRCCTCPATTAMQAPLPDTVRRVAIYTKSDGIVDWRTCITDSPDINLEVAGTHIGLVFNPRVYHLLAQQLTREGVARTANEPPHRRGFKLSE